LDQPITGKYKKRVFMHNKQREKMSNENFDTPDFPPKIRQSLSVSCFKKSQKQTSASHNTVPSKFKSNSTIYDEKQSASSKMGSPDTKVNASPPFTA